MDMGPSAIRYADLEEPLTDYQRRMVEAALRIVERERESTPIMTDEERRGLAGLLRSDPTALTPALRDQVRADVIRRLEVDNPHYPALRREPPP